MVRPTETGCYLAMETSMRYARTTVLASLLCAVTALSACGREQPVATAAQPLQAVETRVPETPANLTMTADKASIKVTWEAPELREPKLTSWSLVFDTKPPITLHPDTLMKI